MTRKHIDLFANTLATAITTTGQTTVDLTDASGLGSITSGDFIPLTIFNSSGNFETVHVTAIATNTITIARGQDGTTAQTWPSLTKVECRLTAAAIDRKTAALMSITATLPGEYTTFTGTLRFYPATNITLKNIVVSTGTAVAGHDSTFNVRKNGSAIFTSPVPTVAVGNTTSTPLAMSTAVTTSDYITIDCTATGGTNACIRIDYEPTE